MATSLNDDDLDAITAVSDVLGMHVNLGEKTVYLTDLAEETELPAATVENIMGVLERRRADIWRVREGKGICWRVKPRR